MTVHAAVRPARSTRPTGWVPFALVALALIPAVAGSLRLVELAYLFRLAFGSSMAACILLGFAAIRRRDVARHRAWMTRAYALALGAGTQTFTLGIGHAAFGPSDLTTDLMLGTGWAINLAIAESAIRRHAIRRTITATGKVRPS